MEIFLTIKLYSCKIELFEIELTIRIKMDWALNNLQWLICHKTQPTNHHLQRIIIIIIISYLKRCKNFLH